jgi:hypothetical protein
MPLQMLLEHPRLPVSVAALKPPAALQTKAKPVEAPVVVYPFRHTGVQLSPVVVDAVHVL